MPAQRLVVLFCLLFLSAVVQAKPTDHRPLEVNLGNTITIRYGSPSWNLDSRAIDTAWLAIRDGGSGKIVQIQLEETAPDSSEFEGRFHVNFGNGGKITLLVFVPPQQLRDTEADRQKLFKMIESGRIQRKPYIWKRIDGRVVLDVYDTRDQAQAALNAYREQIRLQHDEKVHALKPVVPKGASEIAKKTEYQAQLKKMAMDAANREAERVRLEQIERQKEQERQQKAKAETAREQAANKAQAEKLAEDALQLYGQGHYAEAETKFKQSVDLDPTNTSYYYRYGVTLYRNQKYNKALVVLKLAKTTGHDDLERQYFIALAHFKLNELDQALTSFHKTSETKDPVLGPSALFYQGVIQFTQEKYEPAKKSFETVIDTSNDPKIADQADAYLDRIATAMTYKKMRENKWTLTGVIGMMYDSNILLSPDSSTDQGSATNIGDMRLLTVADVNYRPILNEHNEWSTHFTANLTNSSKTDAAIADPFLYTLTFPYTYRGELWKKGFQLTATPGYEILYMDPDGTGTKSDILNSYYLNLDNTFVMRKSWYSTYSLGYRHDNATTPESIGVDNEDADKYSLTTVQTFFLDQARKEALLANLGYIRNGALGGNELYNRIQGGVGFVRPIPWSSTWNIELDVYQAKYPKSDVGRSDLNYTLTTGINKPIRSWITWGLLGSYIKNGSNVSSDAYTKYLVLTTATFVTNF